MAVSISAFDSSNEPYYDGFVEGGKRIANDESDGVRAKFRWDITDNITFNLAGFTFNSSGPASLLTPNTAPSNSPLAAGLEAEDGYNAEFDSPVDQELENEVYYTSIEWGLKPFDVKVLASTQLISTNYSYDFDGTDSPLVSFITKNQYADVNTAELQLLSNENSWGSNWLSWIVGAYYFDSIQGFDPVTLQVSLLSGVLDGLPPALTDLIGDLAPGVLPTGDIDLRALISTESIAGFFQATADVTEWLSITIGGRYQDELREVIKSSSELGTDDGGGTFLANFSDGRHETTYSFKPKISFDFRPFAERDFLLYVTYQEALKSGTYNVVTLSDEPDFVLPEELEAYEIGLKSTWMDGLIRFNMAGFIYKQKNLQVQFVSAFQGGAVSFENAGGAEVDGFDFDATIALFPSLIENLVMTASGAYLNAQFTEYENARGYDDSTGTVFQDGDYSGNDTPRTPEWSATFGLNKSFFFENSVIELGSDVYYNSGFYYLPQNTEESYQDEYHIVNARVSYMYEPWGLRVTAFGNNLENKKYSDGLFQTDFGVLSHLAKPVTYGLKINWELQN